ncbi:MAG: hypothetical protein LBI18_03785, partial [Planctomycetaceae bacterium]|nr:hypothetical protein [Planctomycetaceae bacterium]
MFKKFSVTCLFGLFCISVCLSWCLAEDEPVADQIEKSSLFSAIGDSCSPCDPIEAGCGKQRGWEFDVGGWAESGIYMNSHGWRSNGPMHTSGNARTDF